MDGVQIRLADEAKYLGIILDKKLNWNPHLEKVIHKARHSLWACQRTCGKKWGLAPKQLHWLYVTVVRPQITYGCIAWWECTLKVQTQMKLTRIQRTACMMVTGAFRSTPTAAMECLLGLAPLHLVIRSTARMTTYRFIQTACYEPNMSDRRSGSLRADLLSNEILGMRSDIAIPKTYTEWPYRVILPSRIDWENSGPSLLEGPCWFTDGSVTKQGAGAGISGWKMGNEYPLTWADLQRLFKQKFLPLSTALNSSWKTDGSVDQLKSYRTAKLH